jgi:carboxylate-amine ligase
VDADGTQFRGNDWPTLGVELELQLVDSRSLGLCNAFADLFNRLPEARKGSVKPEFMQCYAELNTGACRTVPEVGADLSETIRAVREAAGLCGARLLWAGTHPFSRWRDQRITPDGRYYHLARLYRETIVRPVTFGLHVHVGVASGDRAVRVGDRLLPYLPLLLALSANSPFWQGRLTGHHSHRIELLEGQPTGGLPPTFRCWDDYRDLVGRMTAAGFIRSRRDLWWDVRPNPDIGTVEVRICDVPADLPDLLGLTALIQCLVHDLAAADERGDPWPVWHPVMVRQNRWRACRFGLDAELVEGDTLESVPARRAVAAHCDRLGGLAAALGCADALAHAAGMARRPSGAERQVALYRRTRDLTEVVREMIRASDPGLSAPASFECCLVPEGLGTPDLERMVAAD